MTCPMAAMAAALAPTGAPRRTRVDRMRALLREQGGMTASVLAAHTGITNPSHVYALLQRDIASGCVQLRDGTYHWNDTPNAKAHAARLTAAAKLLRAHGYTVKAPQ